MSNTLKRFYDESYPERELQRSFKSDIILRRRAEYTSYILQKLQPRKTLDIGGSDGKVAGFIERISGLEIIVSDISKPLLIKCKNGNKVVAVAQNLPFKSGSFDAVYSLQVLEHIINYDKALDEITRVSKSVVIISTDVCISETQHFSPQFNSDGHCHVFGFEELKKLLQNKNLEISNICFPGISRRLWGLISDRRAINWLESMNLAQVLIKFRFKHGELGALFICKKK